MQTRAPRHHPLTPARLSAALLPALMPSVGLLGLAHLHTPTLRDETGRDNPPDWARRVAPGTGAWPARMDTTLQTRAPRRRRPAGFSLIEVLVSVLVVSLGLLGAAALQATALRSNQGSYERTQVSILSQSLFDAMRANLAGVDNGDYNTGGWACSALAAGSLATSDLTRWVGDVRDQINPGACGQVACVLRDCTVSVRWDDSRPTGGLAARAVAIRGQF
jgi:type IV pilus assembly protein PilV